MKTSEMIAMLEKNPKLKFKSGNKFFRLYDGQNSLYGWAGENSEGTWNFNIKDEWELVAEPVPVWEAIKALQDGKTISRMIGSERFTYEPNSVYSITCTAIKYGEWFIEEDN